MATPLAITKKKGETVHMYTFTGMYIGEMTITGSTKDAITIEQKNGRVTKFSRVDGRQLEAKTDRCASWVTEEPRPPKVKKPVKKAKPVAEDEAPAPKKVKKAAAAPAAKPVKKKAKPAPVEESEDDDEDEYEDADA